MSYTLLFGNNFISESPQSVGIYDKILFYLSEDDYGPYLTTEILDSGGENVIVKVEKNTCTYLNEKELIQKYNQRNYILINNKEGENIIQSRILDKKTILVSGIFNFKEFKLIATQNGDDPTEDMKVVPVNFNKEHKAVLGHCKMILEDDQRKIAINPALIN